MFLKYSRKMLLLPSLALCLSACGGSDDSSVGGGGPTPGPANGQIKVEFTWPQGTVPQSKPKSCAIFNQGDYDFHYDTGNINLTSANGSWLDSIETSLFANGYSEKGIDAAKLPDPQLVTEVPTGVNIAIDGSEKGLATCGDQRSHWTFDWNNQSLTPGEEKTIHATFIPDAQPSGVLRLYDNEGVSSQNDRLGQGKAG